MVQKISIIDLRKKEGRGKAITMLLLLQFLISVSGILSTLYTLLFTLESFEIMYAISIILNVMVIILLYNISQWKRKAVYGNFIYLSIVFVPTTLLLMYLLPNGAWAGILILLLIFGSWYWAIKRKLHLFT